MNIRKYLIVLAVLALALLPAACGAQEEPSGDLPELVIGSDDYRPYNYLDENGQAAGVDVFGAVARWTEETFHFNVSGADGSTAWFADYQEELDAAGLSKEYLPTWVPEGYEVTDLQIQEINKSKDIYILYSGENGTAFDLLISIYNEAEAMEQHIFEKDDTPVQTIQVGIKTVYLFENLGVQNAVCQDQNVIYSLLGDLSQNLIEDIFASIGDE